MRLSSSDLTNINIAGRDVQVYHAFNKEHLRGPINDIQIKENTISINCQWLARLQETYGPWVLDTKKTLECYPITQIESDDAESKEIIIASSIGFLTIKKLGDGLPKPAE